MSNSLSLSVVALGGMQWTYRAPDNYSTERRACGCNGQFIITLYIPFCSMYAHMYLLLTCRMLMDTQPFMLPVRTDTTRFNSHKHIQNPYTKTHICLLA